jgi:ribA/ribD-fused uncharacterized protein
MPPKPGADWIPSLHPSNPYNIPPDMIHAGRLPPKHTPTHILFFGYEKDGHDDPTVGLQQWYPSPFKSEQDGGLEFTTTEHYMMYHKALVMSDAETATKILAAPHPSEAKALGRQVRNFDGEKWGANADRVVEEGNWLKFSQHEDLKAVLLGTGDKVLVEARYVYQFVFDALYILKMSARGEKGLLTASGSPNDRIWGIGFNSEEAMDHQSEWGANRLGKALMRVRDKLRYIEK